MAFGVIFLFIIFLGNPMMSAIGSSPYSSDMPKSPFQPDDDTMDSPELTIESVTGGLGLTLVIKNEGTIDASNVMVSFQITNGLLIIPRSINHEIPVLAANESTKVRSLLVGIGLGIITDIPKVTITWNSQNTSIGRGSTYIRIFGPIVKIIGEFYEEDESFAGYTLFCPSGSTTTYLINNSGDVVYTWESGYKPALSVYLLENGNILRTAFPGFSPRFLGGGIGGRVEIFDWNGTCVWDFEYSTYQYCLHHDVEMLPNGNVLMIAWEYKTAAEAIAAGRDPNSLPMGQLWPDHVIEVEPTGNSGGNIVWEWHIWDHLIQDYDPTKENYGNVEDHPELLDINYEVAYIGTPDWNHINSIDYHEEFDQIILSSAYFSEIWIVDHSTTTEEAAGHTGGNSGKGGDILYRWGNPEAYRAGSTYDRVFFMQHDAHWVEPNLPGEGDILVFNNGLGRPGLDYSSVDEIIPPVDENGNYSLEPGSAYEPEEPAWLYAAENPLDFYSMRICSSQRLPNGNTLICNGVNGIFFEVNPEKEIVWEYINPYPTPIPGLNRVFKIYRYAPDYPGLENLFD